MAYGWDGLPEPNSLGMEVKMRHKHNIQAFLNSRSTNSSLVEVYNKLVAIELSIKGKVASSSGTWGNFKHRIVTEIAREDSILANQLGNMLTQLKTRKMNGNIGSISNENYPELRYLVHEDDFPSQGSSESEIASLLQKVNDVVLVLRQKGYSL